MSVASQFYTDKCGVNVPYHMNIENGENVGNLPNDSNHNYGVPDHWTYDGGAVRVGWKTKTLDTLPRIHIMLHTSTPHRLNVVHQKGPYMM